MLTFDCDCCGFCAGVTVNIGLGIIATGSLLAFGSELSGSCAGVTMVVGSEAVLLAPGSC